MPFAIYSPTHFISIWIYDERIVLESNKLTSKVRMLVQNIEDEEDREPLETLYLIFPWHFFREQIDKEIVSELEPYAHARLQGAFKESEGFDPQEYDVILNDIRHSWANMARQRAKHPSMASTLVEPEPFSKDELDLLARGKVRYSFGRINIEPLRPGDSIWIDFNFEQRLQTDVGGPLFYDLITHSDILDSFLYALRTFKAKIRAKERVLGSEAEGVVEAHRLHEFLISQTGILEHYKNAGCAFWRWRTLFKTEDAAINATNLTDNERLRIQPNIIRSSELLHNSESPDRVVIFGLPKGDCTACYTHFSGQIRIILERGRRF